MRMKRNKSRPFQERTNTLTFPLILQPTQSTMDELCVSPAIHATTDKALSSRKGEATIRRVTRYTQAEQALAESFRHSQKGLTTPEIQIDALLRAVYVIQTRVADARESLEKLKSLLENRAAEPHVYQALQRERWLEERRLLAAEEFSKILKRSLSTVPFSAIQPQAPRRRPSNANPHVNLVRFLEFPWHRVSIRGLNYRQLRPDKAVGRISLPRIHRHNTLLPLLLPTHSTQRHRFHGTKVPFPPQLSSTSTRGGSRCTSYSSSSAKSSVLPDPLTTDESPVSIMRTTSVAIVSPPPPRSVDVDGVATIWRQPPVLSREDILKDLVVSMPDYVNDLLAEFDSVVSSTSVHLLKPNNVPIPIPDPLISKPSTTPDNFLSSQSETSTVDSFTLPNGHKPTKRRHSVMFSFPDALSSRTSIRSRDDPSPLKSRSAWRFSSPPSSFPGNLPRDSGPTNEPAQQVHSMPKRSSISISDLRSVFTTSPPATVPPAPSTPLSGPAAPQRKENGEEKLFARLKRRMSVLRRF